jgi:hypothetical protein
VAGATDTLEILEAPAGSVGHLTRCCGKRLSQEPMQYGSLANLCLSGAGYCANKIPQFTSIWLTKPMDEADACIEADISDLDEGSINTVDT